MAKMWVVMNDYFFTHTNENSAWVRSLYTNTRMSFIHSALAGQATVHSKAGWIKQPKYGKMWVSRSDAAVVHSGQSPYVLVVLSTAYGRDGALIGLVQAVDAVHAEMFR